MNFDKTVEFLARVLVARHGEDAPLRAASTADACFSHGDIANGAQYIEVVNCCWSLLDPLPSDEPGLG